MRKAIEVQAVIRQRNQVTLPPEALVILGVSEGDRIVFDIDPDTKQAVIRPLRDSYSSALRGVYGSPEEVAAYIRGERAGWE